MLNETPVVPDLERLEEMVAGETQPLPGDLTSTARNRR